VSQTVTTAGGLTQSLSQTRTVTLANPDNPLSLTQLTGTYTLNGQSYITSYDAAAHTLTDTTPEGRTTVMTLAALGRAIREEVPGITPTDSTYDAHGRLVTLTQGTRSTTMTYGSDGLVAAVTDSLNQTTSYTRDPDGRVTGVRRADGAVFAFAYDPAG